MCLVCGVMPNDSADGVRGKFSANAAGNGHESLDEFSSRLLPELRPDDIAAIERFVRELQENPPRTRDGKEEAVRKINRLLTATDHRLKKIGTREIGRLGIAAGRPGSNGLIVFRGTSGKSSGFVQSSFQVRSVPSTYVGNGLSNNP